MSNQTTTQRDNTSFNNLGISTKLLKILTDLNFVEPTPIQAKAIPIGLKGSDIIGIAQTGTGKTLAFALPMIEQIARNKKIGLVVVPTRELAEQVYDTYRKIGARIGLKTALLIGGDPMGRQIQMIKNRPHVIVGTPGRINDHLQRRILKLGNTGILVLDEADRMLDMGFAPQIKEIVKQVPRNRQTMLFSATMPREIEKLAAQHMSNPIRIQVAQEGTVAERVHQEFYVIARNQKNRLLDKLLADYAGTVLVFSRTKHGARKLCKVVKDMNHAAAEIHSNLSPAQRRRSLSGFKSGTFRVMIATDIAARGIDVANIELVINYDLPDHLGDYVHRVGRTGRAGKKGKAISFVNPDQKNQIRGIERLVRQRFAIAVVPELPAERPSSFVSGGYSERPGSRRNNFRPKRNNKFQSKRHSNSQRARVRL